MLYKYGFISLRNDYIYVWYISECRVRDQAKTLARFFFKKFR